MSSTRRPASQREGSAGLLDSLWGYEADLERLAEQLCHHHQDAEDVAHGALVKAVTHLEGFRSEATLRTWLHRIAVNECAMLRRRPPAVSIEALGPRTRDASSPDPDEGPEEAALEADRRRAVLSALEQLPTRERLVVLLSVGRGLPADAVARRTGLSVPAVRSLLYRARRRIRAEVGQL